MSDTSTQFDHLIKADGPAALVIREHLIPAEGADAVFFPATYADIGYNIDWENQRDRTGRNVCLIDSVGSQANRIEPMFKEERYSALVPQIVIKVGNKEVNLLDVGHRAGDAIARCSELKDDLNAAFQAILQNNNAMPLAKIAPTSIVFGVWDSRDTQAKLPRLIASTVRAYDVRKLTRSATYIAPVDYVGEGVLSADDAAKADGNTKNPLSATGFVNALATQTHGGVIADGGIRRDAVLALSALRLLAADTPANTIKLQRYILGLALVAFTKLPLAYYRQGTILTLDPDHPREFKAVHADGRRTDVTVTHDAALDFAQKAAEEFGVDCKKYSKPVLFGKSTAKAIIDEAKKKKKGDK
jgi:CRISPR-associated protein Csb1